jgi:hypothetical protein
MSRAVHLNSDILNEKRDTIFDVKTEYKDTTLYFEGIRHVYHNDTVILTDTIIHKKDKPLPDIEMEAVSKNKIAKARYWVEKSKRHLEIIEMLDTVIALRDSIKFQEQIINHKQKIIVEKEAEIKKIKSWRENIIEILWIVGGLVVLYLIIKLIIYAAKSKS